MQYSLKAISNDRDTESIARNRIVVSVCVFCSSKNYRTIVVSDKLDFVFGGPKHELETFYHRMRNLLRFRNKFLHENPDYDFQYSSN